MSKDPPGRVSAPGFGASYNIRVPLAVITLMAGDYIKGCRAETVRTITRELHPQNGTRRVQSSGWKPSLSGITVVKEPSNDKPCSLESSAGKYKLPTTRIVNFF